MFLIYICVIHSQITQNIKQHSIWKLFTRSKPKKENSVRIVRALLKRLMIRQPAPVLARMWLPKVAACFSRKKKGHAEKESAVLRKKGTSYGGALLRGAIGSVRSVLLLLRQVVQWGL